MKSKKLSGKVIRNHSNPKAKLYRTEIKLRKLSRSTTQKNRRVQKQQCPLPKNTSVLAVTVPLPEKERGNIADPMSLVHTCTRSNSTSQSSSSRCVSPMPVTCFVHFPEESPQIFEISPKNTLPKSDKAKLWWTQKEIQKFRRREIKQRKEASLKDSNETE